MSENTWTPDGMRLARLSPLGLAELVVPDFESTPEMALLSYHFMQAVLAAKMPKAASVHRRKVIALPPRMGKSTILSQVGVAWALMVLPPPFRTIIVTYESELAAKFGKAARDIVDRTGRIIFGREVDQSSSAADNWSLIDSVSKQKIPNGLLAVGSGGSILGRGGNLVIVDDPSKPGESEQVRAAAYTYFTTVVRSRTEPGTSFIITGQRVAESDLIGKLLNTEGVQVDGKRYGAGVWMPVILPWRAEHLGPAHLGALYHGPLVPDLLGRAEGEVLWPGHWNEEEVRERDLLPSHIGAAILQQRPTFESERQSFHREWFRYCDFVGTGENAMYRLRLGEGGERSILINARDCTTFFTMDLASSQARRSDETAIGVWKYTTHGQFILIDLVHGHFNGPQQEDALFNLFDQYRPSVIYVGAEGFEATLVQRLSGKLPMKGLPPRRSGANKLTAADSAATVMRSENLFWPTPGRARWVNQLEDQMLKFPMEITIPGTDDLIDVVSYAVEAKLGKKQLTGDSLKVMSDVRVDDDDPGRGWVRVGAGRWDSW